MSDFQNPQSAPASAPEPMTAREADLLLALRQDWIAVTERMPEPGGLYLVSSTWGVRPAYRHEPQWAGGCFQEAVSNTDEGDHGFEGFCTGPFHVTHWMPLPQPAGSNTPAAANAGGLSAPDVSRFATYAEWNSAVTAWGLSAWDRRMGDTPAAADAVAVPDVWAAKGMTVRHIRTGGLYVVQGLAQAKINEQWREVVIYKAASDDRVFVREVGPFGVNFEQVEGDRAPATSAGDLYVPPHHILVAAGFIKAGGESFDGFSTKAINAAKRLALVLHEDDRAAAKGAGGLS
jgi:hypothetical protein